MQHATGAAAVCCRETPGRRQLLGCDHACIAAVEGAAGALVLVDSVEVAGTPMSTVTTVYIASQLDEMVAGICAPAAFIAACRLERSLAERLLLRLDPQAPSTWS